MKTKQIVVIDPATHTAEIEDYNNISMLSKIPCTYHLPALLGIKSLPTDLSTVAGVFILGSAANPNESHPWQRLLEAWVARAIQAKVPILGLCYGHQMLAQMLGGRVSYYAPSERSKVQGIRTVSLHPNSLLAGVSTATFVVSHRDEVVKIPPRAALIGTSEACYVEALQYEDAPVWSFQAHPEASEGFIRNQCMTLNDKEFHMASKDGGAVLQAFLGVCFRQVGAK